MNNRQLPQSYEEDATQTMSLPKSTQRSTMPHSSQQSSVYSISQETTEENVYAVSPLINGSDFFNGTYSSTKTSSRQAQYSLLSILKQTPRWRYFYNISMGLLDMAMMLVSFTLVLLLRPDIYLALKNQPILGGIPGTAATFCLVWLIVLVVFRMYERHLMGEGYNLYAKILTAGCVNFISICTIAYIADFQYPQWLVGYSVILATFLTMIERWLMRRYLHRNRRRGRYDFATVLVGSPQGISSMISDLRSAKGQAAGYKPVAIAPIKKVSISGSDEYYQDINIKELTRLNRSGQLDNLFDYPILPFNSRLPERARNNGAGTILVTDVLSIDSEVTRAFSLAVESMNVELAMSASVAHIAGSNIILRQQSVMPILSASLPQYSLSTRLVKRTIDIIGSLLALIPTCILIAIFGIAIKLEDGGPIFYAQERIGLYGKPFKIFKLRSMKVNADKQDAALAAQEGVELGATFKVKEDPRVTKVGKFIRKTSIDEFPQFFNVLKGDMSLVGPRPQRDYEVASYGSLYSTRLLVRPGITGPWQISGRSNLSPEEAEVLDVSYVENWSVMTDIAILIKTVGAVFRGDGAY